MEPPALSDAFDCDGYFAVPRAVEADRLADFIALV